MERLAAASGAFGLANLVGSSCRMGEGASWQRRVEGFVLNRIGEHPTRVWRWDAAKEIWPMP